MPHPPLTSPGDVVEIETTAELEEHLASGRPLAGCVFQDLDLTSYTEALLASSLADSIFLGCLLDPKTLSHAQADGALIFPRIGGIPYDPYKGSLYTISELYDGFDPAVPGSYARSLDARVYAHVQATGGEDTPLKEALARRLHDHSITNALREILLEQRVVAFMGGHGLSRAAPEYRGVAEAARELRRQGYLVITGGGPGAMEAAHLGAWFALRPDGELLDALEILAQAPLFLPVDAWLGAAFEVRARFPRSGGTEPWSLGIPTWVYGHEPPNAFATVIAKYFANSLREEGLLAVARHGVVFAPGSAGTVQEIFEDAAQNHYKLFGGPSPMIFFGKDYWEFRKPVYPLLVQLAAGAEYGRWIGITDDPAEIVRFVERFDRARVR
jgi:predicted Rossmann-fold nucleotide-binding protein